MLKASQAALTVSPRAASHDWPHHAATAKTWRGRIYLALRRLLNPKPRAARSFYYRLEANVFHERLSKQRLASRRDVPPQRF